MSELSEVIGNSVSLHQELENCMVWEKTTCLVSEAREQRKSIFPFYMVTGEIHFQMTVHTRAVRPLHRPLSKLSAAACCSLASLLARAGVVAAEGEMVQRADWSPPASCGEREVRGQNWSKRCPKDAYPA